MISQSTIDKVRDLNIEDVISKYVNLKPKGKGIWACSPFTDEKTPSFVVTPSKNIFKCFSTGHGGDAIKFVMLNESIEFIEAVKRIAEDNNITIDYDKYDSEEIKTKALDKQLYFKVNQAAAIKYGKQLLETDGNHPAFKELIDFRSFTADSLIQWQIGYAPGDTTGYQPDKWRFLSKMMVDKGYFETGKLLGLINEKDGQYYDAFRHRIIYPIHDLNGHVIGFGGRTLSNEKNQPKYINSPESDIYKKDKVLYGLCFAKDTIKATGYAILTEGYTDVISFHQKGLDNTVASCGTSFTNSQAKLLKRFAQKVLICFDGDTAGRKKAIDTLDILLHHGFEVDICPLPDKQDPDSFARSNFNLVHEIKNMHETGIMYKADFLLTGAPPMQRHDHFSNVARSLAMLPPVTRSDLGRKIAKKHTLDWSTLKQLIDEQVTILDRKKEKQKIVRKNQISNLNGNASTYPFFDEEIDQKGNFRGIHINKVKFVNLLSSFGFTRFSIENDDKYTFVKLQENIIKSVHKDEIIDFVEQFIEQDFDYEGAGYEMCNSEMLLNKFYDGMRNYFSKDLFARMKPESPIIINEDNKDNTYVYYKNGFVTINKDGFLLQDYDKMSGSVWEDQMLNREFTPMAGIYDPNKEIDFNENGIIDSFGVFADFVYRISGAYKHLTIEDQQQQVKHLKRFYSLCSIIGYIVHDFYDYKLKAILLTDSTLSDESDGRTGKTLLGQLIGHVRSYCEINGKDFDSNDKNKYQNAKIGTQVLHLNDVKTKGKNRFDFENVFNDITEGYLVNAKYMQPFKNFSKIIISTNKTLNISGGSQRDRIIQFEVSDFFNENHSPLDFYGHWLMKEWDAKEWSRFDNFMCYCCQVFHMQGLIEPSTINLEMRILKDHTSQEFIDFMNDIKHDLEKTGEPWKGYNESTMFSTAPQKMVDFKFDKKKLYHRFREQYEDYQVNWFTQSYFTKWLKMYSKYVMGVGKPLMSRSNGRDFIEFKSE